MKILPLTTTSISVIVAVVLWAIATWLQGQPAPPTPVSLPGAPVVAGPVAPNGAPLAAIPVPGCSETEDALRARVDASQSCAVDDDCTIFDFGYPIQCLTSVAKSEITALRLEYRKYEESCDFRVYYDCPSEPLERYPVCRNNQCAVELRTIDLLREETLDHIGVGPHTPGPARRQPDR